MLNHVTRPLSNDDALSSMAQVTAMMSCDIKGQTLAFVLMHSATCPLWPFSLKHLHNRQVTSFQGFKAGETHQVYIGIYRSVYNHH